MAKMGDAARQFSQPIKTLKITGAPGGDAPGGNYELLVQAAYASGKLEKGESYDVEVIHDNGCALLVRREPCDCKAEVRFRKLRDVYPEAFK
ncbi:hypothetical protein EON81_02985 [bacterium]|nr:MAG: hypothetical protein EON81_02985 [bacterium]